MYNFDDVYLGYIAVKLNEGTLCYKTKKMSSFVKENDSYKLISKFDISTYTKDIIYLDELTDDSNKDMFVFGTIPLKSLYKKNKESISDFSLDVKCTVENIKRMIKRMK